MKSTIYFALLLLLLTTSCQRDEQKIKELFDNYKAALATKDHDFICNALDSKTVDLFKEIATLARSADKARLVKSAIFVRYEVLLMRQRLDKEVLMNLTWEDICQVGTTVMNTEDYLLTSQLGVSKFKDNQAVYYLIMNDQQSKEPLFFIEEDDGWKINAAKAFSQLSKMSFMTSITSGNRIKINEQLVKQVENITGQPIKPTIWAPPANW